MKVEKHNRPSVHKGIVEVAIRITKDCLFLDEIDKMVYFSSVPDNKGDRLNGKGMHYYCAQKPNGKECRLDNGYYCNGNKKTAPSPRTMFESEYEMALGLYFAGYKEHVPEYLARATHMLADVCCPAHSCGLTYFSKYGKFHKRYEGVASKLFWFDDEWETVIQKWVALVKEPAAIVNDDEELFNSLARTGKSQLNAMLGDDEKAMENSIVNQLTLSIANVAMIFKRFADDVKEPPFLQENKAYKLENYDKTIYLTFNDKGFFNIKNEMKECLCINDKKIYFSNDVKQAIDFTLGKEEENLLYVNGNPNYLLGCKNGKFKVYSRKNLFVNMFKCRFVR